MSEEQPPKEEAEGEVEADADAGEEAPADGGEEDTRPQPDDDEAADTVWLEVDAKMDERRRSRREKRIEESLEKYRSVRPKLQHQFTDLKRDLQYVSEAEWDNLPEPGEHRKHSASEKRNERYVPAPDSLLDRARKEQEVQEAGKKEDAKKEENGDDKGKDKGKGKDKEKEK